jgi:hypothetical protein
MQSRVARMKRSVIRDLCGGAKLTRIALRFIRATE